jgi:hypothetical protein
MRNDIITDEAELAPPKFVACLGIIGYTRLS